MTPNDNTSGLGIHDHINEPSSLKMVPIVSPQADKTDSSQQELDFLFSPLFEEYFTAGNQNGRKMSFLNGPLKEEVYVVQPDGLKQAPRAWGNEILSRTSDPPINKSIGNPIAAKPKLDADLSGTPIDHVDKI
ncbi:hypothetical protein Tco_0428760 [Tanacetum coccineum]